MNNQTNIKLTCQDCDGTGITVTPEHDPNCNGQCSQCPVPVLDRCGSCQGWGSARK